MQVLSESTPKARKPHRCDHCGHPVAIGEIYDRAFIKDGGETWSWVAHQDCTALSHVMHRDMGLSWDEGICLRDEWSDYPDEMRMYATDFPAVIARFETPPSHAAPKQGDTT